MISKNLCFGSSLVYSLFPFWFHHHKLICMTLVIYDTQHLFDIWSQRPSQFPLYTFQCIKILITTGIIISMVIVYFDIQSQRPSEYLFKVNARPIFHHHRRLLDNHHHHYSCHYHHYIVISIKSELTSGIVFNVDTCIIIIVIIIVVVIFIFIFIIILVIITTSSSVSIQSQRPA